MPLWNFIQLLNSHLTKKVSKDLEESKKVEEHEGEEEEEEEADNDDNKSDDEAEA